MKLVQCDIIYNKNNIYIMLCNDYIITCYNTIYIDGWIDSIEVNLCQSDFENKKPLNSKH